MRTTSNAFRSMVRFVKRIAFILLSAFPLYAAEPAVDESTYPTGCLDTGYHYKMKTLILHPDQTGQEQSLYFFHNITTDPLNLYQMRGEESDRSLYLNHTVLPNQWAVLATSEKEVKYLCAHPDRKLKHGRVIDCAESVKICEFTHVRFGLNNKGNLWIVGNSNRNGAVNGVVHYGIIP